MTFDGERADARALDQLETILRDVAEELSGWRARALKAETDLKASGRSAGAAAGPVRPEVEAEKDQWLLERNGKEDEPPDR